ncbi:hypothetical protein KIL84_022879 [Mauremys mutica]|uniref:Uncharacterized protein n=1 Tax=Mauremys mutica TaxID=74926 RepID=A0A9D3WQN3_9SAUR|nr:hypothetical protein KIL84_022879 [Mauremys mutica]
MQGSLDWLAKHPAIPRHKILSLGHAAWEITEKTLKVPVILVVVLKIEKQKLSPSDRIFEKTTPITHPPSLTVIMLFHETWEESISLQLCIKGPCPSHEKGGLASREPCILELPTHLIACWSKTNRRVE